MNHLSTLLLALFAVPALAQNVAPAGGGGYAPPAEACLTPAQSGRIDSLVAANVAALTRRGVLPAPGSRPGAVPLAWPLRQAAGFNYNSIYAISNYVDHNATFPNQIRDYNCGTRTYDTAGGYNHAGTDLFLWPFDMNMMASGQAEIVASADGVIVGRADGNFDRNCAINNSNWNAVYVRHTDGSIAWYGHMKSGSVTSKPVGASVVQGEVLGTVGSSGSSTGPHLHFELHDAAGRVLDPYSGTCGPATTSWSTQKPYYEPTVNTLMTHTAPPVFASCPNPHTINAGTAFAPGERVYWAAYYHDQQAGQVTTYTVYRPDNSVFATWTHSMTQPHFAASYWYWSQFLPANAPLGTWRFTAAYQGSTASHSFTVTTTPTATTAAQSAAFALYPNPAGRQVTVKLAGPPVGGEVVVRNQLGQVVVRQRLGGQQLTFDLPVAAGIYQVTAPTAHGPVTRKLVVE